MSKTQERPKARDFEWIKEGLKAKGYTQRDLARAWTSAEATVSRFLQGAEMPDPPLSKIVALASMLDITIDQVAAGLGYKGERIEPSVLPEEAVPMGTFRIDMAAPGRVRVTIRQETTPEIASKLFAVLGTAGAGEGA